MRDKKHYKFSYKKSGVNIDLGNTIVKKIKPLVKETFDNNVLGDIGGFGGAYKLNDKKYINPILISATDGVGTKLLVAEKLGFYKNIGIDLVAMSVNDIIVQGAKPLFFLDYIAINKIREKKVMEILRSITKGCKEAQCSLIGGETAELPGVYSENKFDLAGFCVGVVEKKKLLPKKNIRSGDIIFGLPSSGVHSNGFSLIRKIMDEKKISYNKKFQGNKTLGNIFLKPTKIYVKDVLSILSNCTIKGLAHITGGGLEENIKRIIPKGLGASIETQKLEIYSKKSIFHWLKNDCKVGKKEMLKTFNCGIGMVLVAERKEKKNLLSYCEEIKQPINIIGSIKSEKTFSFN